MASRWCDCKPADYDEDRTHSVHYNQAYYNGDPGSPPKWEDHGTVMVACTHNDAIAEAEMAAGRFDCRMRPVGKSGHWMGSDVFAGEGQKVEVWIFRGPAEEDYDTARAAS